MHPPQTVQFACPRCDRTPLDHLEAGLRCAGCNVDFPDLAGVQCLFAEPLAALDEWRGRLRFLLQMLEQKEARFRSALQITDPSSTTTKRLQAMIDAYTSHRKELADLLQPLLLTELVGSAETYLALRTKLPSDQGLTTYYNNAHRDWCWGDAENSASLEVIMEQLGQRSAGRTLVLGSGAGRLAYDLHESSDALATIALDFNPLLVLLAQRMTGGERVELHEFPVAPLDMDRQAVLRKLEAPKPARAGLEHCLADVHRPPFPAQSFDTIITPWLIDILPEPFEHLAARINRLLTDGGCWINFGSLNFHSAEPTEQLSREECLEKLAAAGFDEITARDTEIPYLCSPASRNARRETVLSWRATKSRHIKKVPRHEALPDWLVRGKEAVPHLEYFKMQAVSTRIHAFIISLIDGRRSITEMAALLEEKRLMTRAEAEAAIRQFMIKLYEDSRRGSRF